MSPAAMDRAEPALEGADPVDLRRALRRALGIGLWVWPSFTLLDAYMCYVVYPAAPFRWFVAGRVVVEAGLAAAWWASSVERVPIAILRQVHGAAFILAAVCIAAMAIPLGGMVSPYMHGISIVVLVRAVVLPEPWRRALPVFSMIGLSFPAVVAGWALVTAADPTPSPDWSRLAMFTANYVFVVASTAVGLVSCHLVWAARQQVYRARRLGRYRLKAPIGEGGMGEVWLAWDPLLHRNVALKLLRLAGGSNPELVRRFEREAQAASQLRAPHSIQVFDFGASDDGIYYIAMEYLVGTDLNSMVASEGPLPPDRVIRFGIQVCESLDEAHRAGIIHRDVKPQNLFAAEVGNQREFIKLLDFGIARLRAPDPTGARLTQTGQVAGTPQYLAPEVWDGAEADERSDIYALGVTLYYLLTGVTPFDRNDSMGIMLAHFRSEPVPPSVARGEPVAAELEDLVLRCLARRPEDRFQSAAELRRGLEAIESGGEPSRSAAG